MKIGKKTIDVLKNFSEINAGLYVEKGSELKTMAASRKIVAVAVVPEEFPTSFGVYEIGKLLGTMALFSDPEIEIDEKIVRFSSEGRTASVVNAIEGSIVSPPAKTVPAMTEALNDSLVSDVSLPGKVLAEVTKAARILDLPNFELFGDGKSVILRAVDVKNPSSHEYAATLGESTEKFTTVFLRDTFKFLPGDYSITINGPKRLARFVGERSDSGHQVTYYLAAEVSERRS